MKIGSSRGWFAVGAAIGAVVPIAMIATDTLQVLFAPTWQVVAFYPGFFAGGSFYDCCQQWLRGTWAEESGYLAVGVVAVALSYGLVAMLLHRLVVRTRRRAGGTGDGSAATDRGGR
jgi:hypothetical protein